MHSHEWNVIGYTYSSIRHSKAKYRFVYFNQLDSYFYFSYSFFILLLSLADHSYWRIWEQEAIQVCLCQHETKGRSKWLVLEYYSSVSLFASCGDVEGVHSVCGQKWLSWWFAKRSRKWGTPTYISYVVWKTLSARWLVFNSSVDCIQWGQH